MEIQAEAGETVLLYTDGLLHRTGDPMDRAFARLHAAAAGVPRAVRHDPEAVADHVLRAVLPDGTDAADSRGGRGPARGPLRLSGPLRRRTRHGRARPGRGPAARCGGSARPGPLA